MQQIDLWSAIEKSAGPLQKDPAPLDDRVVPPELFEATPPVLGEGYPLVKDKFAGLSVLGLDLSQHSTGYYLHTPQGASSGCLPPVPKFPEVHREVMARRWLADQIEALQPGPLDFLVVEDVFKGRSHTVARFLHALNTAPDELVLDGRLQVESFLRVNNQSWKALLSQQTGVAMSHMDAKSQVISSLSVLPWDEGLSCLDWVVSLGMGKLDDRLDAFSLALYPFLQPPEVSRRLVWSGVKVVHATDVDNLRNVTPPGQWVPLTGRVSKESVRTRLKRNPRSILVTPRPVPVGLLDVGVKGSSRLDEVFLAFWRKDVYV